MIFAWHLYLNCLIPLLYTAPPRPESLRVENETDDSFWVVWDPPKNYSRSSVDKYELMIERYSISTLDLHRSHRPIFRGTIEGTKTWKKISNVTAKGTIRIGITAFAHGQTSPEAMTIHHLTGIINYSCHMSSEL